MIPSKDEIKTVVDFFKRTDLPEPLQINEAERITDMKKFAEASIEHLKNAYGRKAERLFYSNYDRMNEVKEIIENISEKVVKK